VFWEKKKKMRGNRVWSKGYPFVEGKHSSRKGGGRVRVGSSTGEDSGWSDSRERSSLGEVTVRGGASAAENSKMGEGKNVYYGELNRTRSSLVYGHEMKEGVERRCSQKGTGR